MEHQCKDCKHNHLNNGSEDMCSVCSGHSDKFEPIEEKPMEQKKYRVLKEIETLTGSVLKPNGGLLTNLKKLEGTYEDFLIRNGYIEEVKEDTLESILQEYKISNAWNIENDILKTKLTEWRNKEVTKQKIELLKQTLNVYKERNIDFLNFEAYLRFEISELENKLKEIK